MKRSITFMTLVLMALTMWAGAEIKFEKTSVKLGTFEEKQVQTCVFTFTNVGDEPLIIHQAYSSCGCTVPSFSKEAVKPGESGEIHVSYNGKGKFPGAFKKPITVRSNATNAIVRLYIEGVMTVNGQAD